MSIKKCPASPLGSWCKHDCNEWDPCKMLPNQEVPAERRVQIPDPWAMKPDRQMVYTILWSYTDNSDYGVVDVAFRRKEDAEELLKLLDEHSQSKRFVLCQSVLKS